MYFLFIYFFLHLTPDHYNAGFITDESFKGKSLRRMLGETSQRLKPVQVTGYFNDPISGGVVCLKQLNMAGDTIS